MKYIAFIPFLFFPFISNAQSADSIWLVNNYTKKEVTIPMRDGIKLFTTIYTPNDNSEKHPVLLTRTPYSVSPYGEKFRPFWYSYQMRYFREGFIMVYQDIRGKYMSEGKFEVVRPFNPNKKRKRISTRQATAMIP